jgi:uridine kinase
VTPRHADRNAAIAEIAALPRGRAVFVGIDGFAGSGKSSLAAAASARVPGSVVVSIDDFAGPLVPEWDWARFNAQVVRPLLAGRAGRYQRWEWNRDEGAEWHDVPTGRLVIVEGVSCTRHEVIAPWQLTVWVDAPREVRLARALERDGAAMLPHWLEVWMPSEERYAAREEPMSRVDLIVSGT